MLNPERPKHGMIEESWIRLPWKYSVSAGMMALPNLGPSNRMILNAPAGNKYVSYWYDHTTKRHRILPLWLQSVVWSEDGSICSGIDRGSKEAYLVDANGSPRKLGFSATRIVAIKEGLVYAYKSLPNSKRQFVTQKGLPNSKPTVLQPDKWAGGLIGSRNVSLNRIAASALTREATYFNGVIIRDPGYHTEYFLSDYKYEVSIVTSKGLFSIPGKWKGGAVTTLDSGAVIFRIGLDPYSSYKFDFKTKDDYFVYDWKHDEGSIVSVPTMDREFAPGGTLPFGLAHPVPRSLVSQIIRAGTVP